MIVAAGANPKAVSTWWALIGRVHPSTGTGTSSTAMMKGE
jgi:hypothetical protein